MESVCRKVLQNKAEVSKIHLGIAQRAAASRMVLQHKAHILSLTRPFELLHGIFFSLHPLPGVAGRIQVIPFARIAHACNWRANILLYDLRVLG